MKRTILPDPKPDYEPVEIERLDPAAGALVGGAPAGGWSGGDPAMPEGRTVKTGKEAWEALNAPQTEASREGARALLQLHKQREQS